MATVDKTWVFAANTEGLADVGDSAITVTWDSTPQALEFLGAATGTTERARRASTGETWETWGVPPGSTVTDLQVISWNTRKWSAAVSATVAMRVVGSGGSSVHTAGDLVGLGLAIGSDAAPVSQGAGTSRAVDGGSQPSTTDVRLEVQLTLSGTAPTYDLNIDNILLRITYTAGGALNISGAGAVASAEAIGTARLDINVSPAAIASAEAIGTAVITGGAVTVSPSGIASTEAAGTPAVTPGAVTVSPSSVASAESVGTPRLDIALSGAGAIASAEAVGVPAITVGPVTVSPAGIASGEVFGQATITGGAPAGSSPRQLPMLGAG